METNSDHVLGPKMNGKKKQDNPADNDGGKVAGSTASETASAAKASTDGTAIRETYGISKAVSNIITEVGGSKRSATVEENHGSMSIGPEPSMELSNGANLQSVDGYSNAQVAEGYNQLICQYYKLEQKRRNILYQLQQFGCYNHQGLENSSYGLQLGTSSSSQEYHVPTNLASCSTTHASRTCADSSAMVGPQKSGAVTDGDIVKTVLGAAEKEISSMNMKTSVDARVEGQTSQSNKQYACLRLSENLESNQPLRKNVHFLQPISYHHQMATNPDQILGKQRCKRIPVSEEDLFSRLSDEIVIHILSRLSFQEAAQTSILSRRWKKLWAYTLGPKLNFYPPLDKGLIIDYSLIPESRRWFVQAVNHCLELHQMPTVDEFTVCFDMDSSCSSIVHGWLQFAFRKRVRKLRLYLSGPHNLRNQYAFPDAKMLQKQLSTLSPLNTYRSNPSNLCAGISNLRDIDLCCVDVNQEALEYLLSYCPFLELLSVMLSYHLIGLNVPSQAQRLKRLQVISCRFMEKLVIFESNLTSLVFAGPKITLSLENVPFLSQLSLGGEHCLAFFRGISLHFSLLSQLKKLSLCMSEKIVMESVSLPLEVPELSNLEHIEVTMQTGGDGLCLLWPIILVKAAPFLHKFSVQFNFFKSRLGKIRLGNISDTTHFDNRWKLWKATRYHHEYLKVVELKCFYGFRNQVELAKRLLRIAKSLDKLVLDVRIRKWGSPIDLENLAEKHIDELRGRLPSGAELVLLK